MDKLILAVMFALMLSFNVIAGDTVTIIDPAGDLQICKVTESGVIVCL